MTTEQLQLLKKIGQGYVDFKEIDKFFRAAVISSLISTGYIMRLKFNETYRCTEDGLIELAKLEQQQYATIAETHGF